MAIQEIVETTRLSGCPCLSCGKILDAATTFTGKAKPRVGDISICMYCGHIAAYGENVQLRPLSDEEMHYVAGNKEVLRYQEILHQLREKRDQQWLSL